MTKYLLAAEADQIQDLIFRASRLREVVGGSQLLTRFCREGAETLVQEFVKQQIKQIPGLKVNMVVHDGGAFRIRFDAEKENDAKLAAITFGRELAELYRRCTDGSLTVAEPVKYEQSVNPAEEDEGFEQANPQAQAKLREAKSHGRALATVAHLPYLAFCASCGVAIASERHQRHEERENYYCTFCLQKEKERDAEVEKIRKKKPSAEDFLGAFHQAVAVACRAANMNFDDYDFPEQAEDVAAFDLTGRRYVAYLLADGNGMGKLFADCRNEEQMKALSKSLPEVVRAGLAAHCPDLLRRIEPQNEKKILPVLPLILGGDDLLALLPAAWAIDIAARFCQTYQELMEKKLRDLEFLQPYDAPTIAAIVVICKGSYPHALAHRQGEELLKQAKQFARGLEVETGKRVSALSFILISGNEVGKPMNAESTKFRPSACPYFIAESQSETLRPAGLSVSLLHKNRLSLTEAKLPAKRRAELEQLFDVATRMSKIEELEKRWQPRFKKLIDRIERRSGGVRKNGSDTRKTTFEALRDAVLEMGDDQAKELLGYRAFVHPFVRTDYGHGLADLLTLWDYLYDVTMDLSKYEE